MKEILLEGKVKTVWSTDLLGEVIVEYHDKVTAGNGRKVDFPEGKGEVCCQISSILFEKLQQAGVNTHYIKLETPTRMRCKKVGIVPIEVIVRNVAAGSLCRQTYLREGIALNPPLVEFYLKDDDKDDKRIVLMGKGCVDRGDGKMDRKEYAPEGTAETVEDAEKALHEKAMQKGEYLSQRLEERVLPVVDGTKFAKKE